jgi:hypothetical protein
MPMRRLLALGGAVWLGTRLARRRSRRSVTVVVGYADGSTIRLGSESPERARLLDLAHTALER